MTTAKKIFVAGATGVLGRRAVARLVDAGHHVTGVARDDSKAALLRRLGATPVVVDLFDATAVKEAVAGHDVVMNLATHIPAIERMAMPGAWSENDRIRREASRNLVDAALATGAERYVQESICFLYEDQGDEWLDEDAPLDAPPHVRSGLEAEAQAERFAAQGGAGVVLRFGQFYGPDSGQTLSMRTMARRRLRTSLGEPRGYAAVIHLDDAAGAVVGALDAPSGTYNVTDDEPLPKEELDQVIARAVGAKPPVVDGTLASRAMASKGELLRRSQRVSNRRFREATGWAPSYPSAREGWPVTAAAMPREATSRHATIVRVLLAVQGATSVLLGVWASLDPRGFYAGFPGAGHHWVSIDGPFNEHLVRDFGGLNLALAAVSIVAAYVLTRTIVRTAGLAGLLFGVPHLLYHATHLSAFNGADGFLNVFGLSGSVLFGALAIVLGSRLPEARARVRGAD